MRHRPSPHRHFRRTVASLTTAGLILLLAGQAWAAAGYLDTTFSSDGIVTTPVLFGIDEIHGVAVQDDGKIVAAGYAHNGTNFDFSVVRYTTAGALDTTFSTDGKVTTPILSANDLGRGVAIQDDGKILVAGYAFNGTNFDFALARYNTDGTLDTSFSGDGKVTTEIQGADFGQAIVLQADGKILVAGQSHNDISLARYNTDGTLDTSFSTDGTLTTEIREGFESAFDVAVQADAKIVAVGRVQDPGVGEDDPDPNTNDFAVVRYDATGVLDPAFDGDGIVTTSMNAVDRPEGANAVVIQPDGKILAAGYVWNDGTVEVPNSDFAFARYDSNGALDTTFDTDGKMTTDFDGEFDLANDVALQADGAFVTVGYSDNGVDLDFAVTRHTGTGVLDTTFDTDGKVTTEILDGDDVAYAMALQADGKIVAAGRASNGVNEDMAAARYAIEGEPPAAVATALTIKAPNQVKKGDKAKISGFLSSAESSCADLQSVSLMKGINTLATKTTAVGGAYVFKQKITKKTTVWVSYLGTASCSPSASAKKTIKLA